MPIYLRQSTASQEIPLGYFVDSGDGNTEETALTINNTDIKLWKAGATTLANKNSGGATHIANGLYYAVLDATDTNTVGPLIIFVHVTGALAVRVECCVLTAAVYDALIAGSANLSVNLVAGQLTVKKNVALSNFAFPMFDTAGALKTGLTVTVQLRKDAGSFAASTNAATEIGTTGWYTINLTQTEMNADAIAFSATASGAVPTTYTIITQP